MADKSINTFYQPSGYWMRVCTCLICKDLLCKYNKYRGHRQKQRPFIDEYQRTFCFLRDDYIYQCRLRVAMLQRCGGSSERLYALLSLPLLSIAPRGLKSTMERGDFQIQAVYHQAVLHTTGMLALKSACIPLL